MPSLFDPIRLRALEVRNRIWVPPLCQYSVLARDGVPTDWHLAHLGSFARGGAGLVIAEASAVTPEGRISPHDTGIWNDEQAVAWSRIVDFGHSQGAAMGIQLAHAGRKASVFPEWGTEAWGTEPGNAEIRGNTETRANTETRGNRGRKGTIPIEEGGWETVSASAVAFTGYAEPRALLPGELPGIVDAFRHAARLAVDAGFDLVEIHAAHGYLVHQFLSPLSNQRQDSYGGSLENRARLLLEIVRAIRHELGDEIPVLVRFSATDWAEGGWDLDQTTQVATWAAAAGADLFDVSTGGLVGGVQIPVGPGYQVPFAEQIKRGGGVETAAVGLIVEAEQAAKIVETGQADAVLLGRASMRDPHWVLHAAETLGVELDYWPPQYVRAKVRGGDPW